jgi:hypothetical protein
MGSLQKPAKEYRQIKILCMPVCVGNSRLYERERRRPPEFRVRSIRAASRDAACPLGVHCQRKGASTAYARNAPEVAPERKTPPAAVWARLGLRALHCCHAASVPCIGKFVSLAAPCRQVWHVFAPPRPPPIDPLLDTDRRSGLVVCAWTAIDRPETFGRISGRGSALSKPASGALLNRPYSSPVAGNCSPVLHVSLSARARRPRSQPALRKNFPGRHAGLLAAAKLQIFPPCRSSALLRPLARSR